MPSAAVQSHQQRFHSIPFSLKVEENAINFSAVSHFKKFLARECNIAQVKQEIWNNPEKPMGL